MDMYRPRRKSTKRGCQSHGGVPMNERTYYRRALRKLRKCLWACRGDYSRQRACLSALSMGRLLLTRFLAGFAKDIQDAMFGFTGIQLNRNYSATVHIDGNSVLLCTMDPSGDVEVVVTRRTMGSPHNEGTFRKAGAMISETSGLGLTDKSRTRQRHWKERALALYALRASTKTKKIR